MMEEGRFIPFLNDSEKLFLIPNIIKIFHKSFFRHILAVKIQAPYLISI